jgi:glycerol-3-phosphate dehydrogenase (NAD+)
MSAIIRQTLKIDCSVLMGANLAAEIKSGGQCETTIASHVSEYGEIFRQLFETPYFSVNVINDVEGSEMAGALKNIVALAARFSDGSGMGENAKAALMRQGLAGIRAFAKAIL